MITRLIILGVIAFLCFSMWVVGKGNAEVEL